ncbi:MAG: hypothetical protein AAF252_06530 [Pseudomonadota bacterium]
MKIFAFLAAGVVLAAGLWGGLYWMMRTTDDARTGPVIAIDDVEWGTRVYAGNDDHATFGIWVDLIAPVGFAADKFDLDMNYIKRACQAILNQANQFTPDGVDAHDIEHVDVNFDFSGEKGWPVEITAIAEDGTCIDRAQSGGHGRYSALSENERFSQHRADESFFAFFRSWGLKAPAVSFANINGARVAKVDFGYVRRIGRDISSLNSLDLCIFAISDWAKEMRVLGIKIDPYNYPRMEIRIVDERRVGFATTTNSLGQAEVLLRKGRCVLPDGPADD